MNVCYPFHVSSLLNLWFLLRVSRAHCLRPLIKLPFLIDARAFSFFFLSLQHGSFHHRAFPLFHLAFNLKLILSLFLSHSSSQELAEETHEAQQNPWREKRNVGLIASSSSFFSSYFHSSTSTTSTSPPSSVHSRQPRETEMPMAGTRPN